ncbi:DUF4124 domain-containing protein [Acidihalobacter prosperus]
MGRFSFTELAKIYNLLLIFNTAYLHRKMARLILFICCLLFATTANATIYRWINAQGNVVFSDTPPPNGHAKTFNLHNHAPIDTIQSPHMQPSQPAQNPSSHKKKSYYRSLEITSPANNTAVRANNGNITVSLKVAPSLSQGDHIRLYMDGAQVYNGTSTQIHLKNVDRGTHTIYAAIATRNGIAIRSPGVSFTVKRHSILFTPSHHHKKSHDTIQQAPRAPMMPRAPQFHAPN